MKKLLIPLAALALALLAACGGQDPAPAGYDPETTAQALLDSGAFSQELSQLDADLVSAYLGLESEPEAAAVYTSLEGGYEELVIVTMADEEAAAAAKTAVEAHLTAQTETETEVQYKPEDLPKLQSAVARQAGSTVVLVVAADYDAVAAVLDGESAAG